MRTSFSVRTCGKSTGPTVVFPDGSSATNPSLAQVKERIGA